MRKVFGALALVAFLAACNSAEERAQKYYESGLALLEAGDPARAAIEFRNVFELMPNHREARTALARVMIEQGNRQEGYSQYLRLVEQYPEDFEGRITLAEIAFSVRNWDELERHGSAAQELRPDDPRVQTITLARQYRTSVQDRDEPLRASILTAVEARDAEIPNNTVLQSILVDGYLRNNAFTKSLTVIDNMLAQDPENRPLHEQRLAVLAQLGENDLLEAQLRTMIELFPEDKTVKSTLLRFYVSRGEMEAAENFLREVSDPAADEPGDYISLIRFISQVSGAEAAMEELDQAIAAHPDKLYLKTLRAGFTFAENKQDEATAMLEEIIEGAEPSDDIRDMQITLARMYISMQNRVGAQQLVDQVLSEDATNVQALKIRAAWQIESDDTDEAIANLRTALDNETEDAQAMTLMAQAYTRSGNPELARDFLSLAVGASGNAPAETIRYARLLISEGRHLPAEDILLPALRLAPGNLGLLNTLGQLYLAMEDLPRAQQVIETMRRLNTQEAQQAANSLEAERLNKQQGPEQALAFLETLATEENADLNAKLSLLRGKLIVGQLEEAQDLAKQMVEADPDNERLQFALAATMQLGSNVDGAIGIYQALLDDNPALPNVRLQLARSYVRKGDVAKADAVIDEGLALQPDDFTLLWAKASYLERDNKIDEAIDIYAKMYDSSSNSIVVANNLASLLTIYRADDPEALERATVVSRRLRGTETPAFQDTYGWIAHLNGDSEEALRYLEPAAEAIAGDPIVQFHLASAYAALEQNDKALESFKAVINLAAPSDLRPQIQKAREEILRLESSQ